jgi:nucleoside-diphosphate-sugar epimerase
MKKAIVLGGHGFLGSAIAAEAKKRGWETTLVSRAGYQECVGTACDLLINADGNSKKYLADKDPNLEFDLSVRSVSQSLHDIQAKSYIFLSTIDVYSDKRHPASNHEEAIIDPTRLSCYGFHKFLAEQLVRRHAKSWLILRLGGFVGPGLKKNSVYDLLMKEKIRVHPDSRYQYLDTAFMAATLFQLAEHGHSETVFNLAGEGTVSLRDIAHLIPGNPLAGAPFDKEPEHYEINVAKIKTLVPLPPTRQTVERFVQDALAGTIKLK